MHSKKEWNIKWVYHIFKFFMSKKYHDFKNRTGPTTDWSWFQFALVNWPKNGLNWDQTSWTDDPIGQTSRFPLNRMIRLIFLFILFIFYNIKTTSFLEDIKAPSKPSLNPNLNNCHPQRAMTTPISGLEALQNYQNLSPSIVIALQLSSSTHRDTHTGTTATGSLETLQNLPPSAITALLLLFHAVASPPCRCKPTPLPLPLRYKAPIWPTLTNSYCKGLIFWNLFFMCNIQFLIYLLHILIYKF